MRALVFLGIVFGPTMGGAMMRGSNRQSSHVPEWTASTFWPPFPTTTEVGALKMAPEKKLYLPTDTELPLPVATGPQERFRMRINLATDYRLNRDQRASSCQVQFRGPGNNHRLVLTEGLQILDLDPNERGGRLYIPKNCLVYVVLITYYTETGFRSESQDPLLFDAHEAMEDKAEYDKMEKMGIDPYDAPVLVDF